MSRPRNCPNGHHKTRGNVFVKVSRKWNKATGGLKTYRNRGCRSCQRQLQRLSSQRRRALGKQLSYPQWLAQRKDAR